MKKYFFLVLFTFFYSKQVGAQYILHIAGTSILGDSGDGGPATVATFTDLNAICMDAAGNLYIGANDKVRKIDMTSGIVTTIAGSSSSADTTDYIPATSAGIFEAVGLCIGGADGIEYLYIADSHYKVRKVNLATGIITTAAGRGPGGYGGDGGQATAALLGEPRGVAIDPEGNLYIAEYFNNTIRKVTAATGIITTIAGVAVAGTGSYGGDGGPATDAQLDGPEGVALDSHGNVYIADQYNNRIRRVDAITGIITTVAGIGPTSSFRGSFSGDGGPATAAGISIPVRIAFDKYDNMYIADEENLRIRRVDAGTGIITTYAGNGIPSGLGDTIGDGGLATAARLNSTDLCLDSCGNLFFDDQTNVRAVTASGPSLAVCAPPSLGVASPQPSPKERELWVWPNPSGGAMTMQVNTTTNEPVHVVVTNVLGQKVKELTTTTNTATELQIAQPGIYFINARTESGHWVERVVVE